MHFDCIINQGSVFLEKGETEVIDIGIKNSRIEAIGDLSQSLSKESFSAKGLTIIPGIIDSHVHMREPGMEYEGNLHSETRSALLGGVTAVLEMPNTYPLTISGNAIEDKCARARGRSWVDYAFYVGAHSSNFEKLPQLEKTFGCCGIKIFMCTSTGDLCLDAEDQVYSFIMKNTKSTIAIHAEDASILAQAPNYLKTSVLFHHMVRSKESAVSAVKRAVKLAQTNRRKIHILHVSSDQEIQEIAKAKQYVTAELTPHHLLLSSPECYEKYGSLAQSNPPIRESFVRNFSAFTTIGSDHAPHTLQGKKRPYPLSPSGMPGTQTMCPLILDCVNKGMLTLKDFVNLLCINPAKLFNIKGRGHLKVGTEASFTFLDMDKKNVISSQWLGRHAQLSPFLDWAVQGWPVGVMIQGNWCMREGETIGHPAGKPLEFLVR